MAKLGLKDLWWYPRKDLNVSYPERLSWKTHFSTFLLCCFYFILFFSVLQSRIQKHSFLLKCTWFNVAFLLVIRMNSYQWEQILSPEAIAQRKYSGQMGGVFVQGCVLPFREKPLFKSIKQCLSLWGQSSRQTQLTACALEFQSIAKS